MAPIATTGVVLWPPMPCGSTAASRVRALVKEGLQGAGRSQPARKGHHLSADFPRQSFFGVYPAPVLDVDGGFGGRTCSTMRDAVAGKAPRRRHASNRGSLVHDARQNFNMSIRTRHAGDHPWRSPAMAALGLIRACSTAAAVQHGTVYRDCAVAVSSIGRPVLSAPDVGRQVQGFPAVPFISDAFARLCSRCSSLEIGSVVTLDHVRRLRQG